MPRLPSSACIVAGEILETLQNRNHATLACGRCLAPSLRSSPSAGHPRNSTCYCRYADCTFERRGDYVSACRPPAWKYAQAIALGFSRALSSRVHRPSGTPPVLFVEEENE